MAAASAPASTASLCHYTSHSLSFPSSSPKYFETHFFLKPISARGSYFSLAKANNPIINKNSSRRSKCQFLKASQSSALDSASQTCDEDEASPQGLSKSDDEEDRERKTSFELIMSAYKEAILNGDEKTVSNIEELIYMVEKEKNGLLEKVSTLSEEIITQKDRYIRLQADFDNFRKRTEIEKLTIRSNAKGEVIESLLPMVDNFERAKQHIKLETEQEKKIDASYQSIYKQFVEIMNSLGVSAVSTVGKPFDPSLHEAIARQESEEFKEGIIIQEFRSGFLLEDRLLRPAMVKVSSGPGESRPSSEQPATAGVDETATAGIDEGEFREQSVG